MKKYIIVVLLILSVLFTLGSFGVKYLRDRAEISIENDIPLSVIEDVPPVDDTAPMSLYEVAATHIADKYNVPARNVSFVLFQSTEDFFRSEATVEGLGGNISVLAKRVGDTWEVIFVDEGIVPCDIVDPIDFPDTVMPECWDTATDSLKTRLIL